MPPNRDSLNLGIPIPSSELLNQTKSNPSTGTPVETKAFARVPGTGRNESLGTPFITRRPQQLNNTSDQASRSSPASTQTLKQMTLNVADIVLAPQGFSDDSGYYFYPYRCDLGLDAEVIKEIGKGGNADVYQVIILPRKRPIGVFRCPRMRSKQPHIKELFVLFVVCFERKPG